MLDWIRGWWTTFQLWRHDRETYDFLVDYRHDPNDFVDAPRTDNGGAPAGFG